MKTPTVKSEVLNIMLVFDIQASEMPPSTRRLTPVMKLD